MDYIFNKEALGTELQRLDVVFLVSLRLGREGSRHKDMRVPVYTHVHSCVPKDQTISVLSWLD